MKRRALFFFLFLVAVFLSPQHIRAENKYSKKTLSWKCLTVPKDSNGKALDCTRTKDTPDKCSGEGVPGHRMRLTQSGLTAGTDVYVVGCVADDKGTPLCTTGDQKADNDVYGDWKDGVLRAPSTYLDQLVKNFEYKFEGLFINGKAKVEPPSPFTPVGDRLAGQGGWYEWQDYTPRELNRKWLTFQWVEQSKAPVGAGGGNQQGTLSFTNIFTSCASIAWDPYGRLFDSQTLEPVSNTQVTLQIKKGDVFTTMTPADLLGGNIINPQQVYEDGAFSFMVPDGDYKLLPTLPYVTDLAKIDPNYKKAYSEIYAGEVIQQRGGIQHRDVAIATQNTNTAPKAISFFYDAAPNGLIVLDGTVSHPLTKINVKTAKISTLHPASKIPYRTIQTYQADKMGRFNFTVAQNEFEKTGSYTEIISGIELVKVDLRTGGESSTSSKVVALEPIPQYLEGYAYNSVGTVLSNATVGVYLSSGVSPVMEVETDEDGLFKITTDFLPSSTYNLRYTTKTGVTFVVKPSTFLAQNQQYYIQNRINPYAGNYKSGALAPTGGPNEGKISPGKGTNIQTSGKRDDQKMENNQTPSKQISTQAYILIIILILLLGGVIGTVVYLKKRKVNL